MAFDDAHDSATAVAHAMASAVSYIFADCYVDGQGWACAAAGTRISEAAHAVAVAHATAWAGAISCGTCKVNVDAYVVAVSKILTTAASEAHGDVCSGALLAAEHPFNCLDYALLLGASLFPPFSFVLPPLRRFVGSFLFRSSPFFECALCGECALAPVRRV